MDSERIFRPVWVRREHILDRRTWVYYLIINERASRYLGDQIEISPDERFFEVLGAHVEAYVSEGQMPPEAIATAVMNVGDDYLAGREIILRAGDYIAVQNFVREQAA